jgi:hypothetical protein
MASLAAAVVVTLVAARYDGLLAAALVAATVAVVSTCGKLGFDSIVQRDAPDANRGRSFAKFEVRFQLVWVVGAMIPVVVSIPQQAGFLMVAGTAGFALFSYIAGQRAAQRAHLDRVSREPVDPAPPDPTWIQRNPGADPTQLQ